MQENALLKQQEGEDEDVLMLSPDAKNTLVKAEVERLSHTWNRALTAANRIKEEIVQKATQQQHEEGKAEIIKLREEALQWKNAYEEAKVKMLPGESSK